MKSLLQKIGPILFGIWTIGIMATYFYFYKNYGLAFLRAFIILSGVFFLFLPFAFLKKPFPFIEIIRKIPSIVHVPVTRLIIVFYGCVISWILIFFFLKPDISNAKNSILSVTLVSLITLAGFSIGSALIRRFRLEYESFLERFILAILLGFGMLMLIIYCLGMTGLLYSTLGYILVFGTLILFRKEWLLLFREIQKTHLEWKIRPFLTFENFAIIVSFTLFAFATTGLLCQFAAGWDEMHTYQAFPKAYAEAHRIVDFKYWFTSGFPQNTEMLYTLGFLLKGFTVASGLNTVFYFLLPGILILIKRFVFPKASSLVLVLLFLLSAIPYLMITIDHKIDLAFWSYTLLATFYLLKFFHTHDRKIFLLSCVIMGIAAGIKYGFFSLVLPSFIIVLFFFPREFNLKKRVINIIICLTIIALCFSPWAVKNIIFTGNPVEPALGDLLSRDDTFFKQIGRSYSEHLREHFSDSKILAEDQDIKDWKFYVSLPFRLTFNYEKKSFHDVVNIGSLYLLLMPLLFFLPLKKVRIYKKTPQILIGVIFFQIVLWIFLSNFIPHYAFQSLLLSLIFFTTIVNIQKNRLLKALFYIAIIAISMATILYRFNGTLKNLEFFAFENNKKSASYSLYKIAEFINDTGVGDGLIWNQGIALHSYVKQGESKIIFDPYLHLFHSFCLENDNEYLPKKMKSLNISAFIFFESPENSWESFAEKAKETSPKTAQKFINSEKCFLEFKDRYLSKAFSYNDVSIYVFR